MAELIGLEFEIDKSQFAKFDREVKLTVEEASRITVRKAFDRIDIATGIKKYTQNSGPAKPSGSTYIRTFKLKKNARRKITKHILPVEGEWLAQAKYASFVIGLANQQALIHSGRWPALELAINDVNSNISNDFDKAMKKVQR